MPALPVYRKHLFDLPDGIIYLDGNSLGPLPKAARKRIDKVVTEEWGKQLIRAWNDAGWMQLPALTGDRIAGLIGAAEGSVMTGDTLSIKIYQALAAALQLNPGRKRVLTDRGNFPADLYIAQALLDRLDQGHELLMVEPEQVINAIDESVAAVLLTEVDYRSGRKHDMLEITRRSQEVGAMTVWDLAHSAGALPIALQQSNCEFAAGCGYKYLNGGPGAPAFIYVRPDLLAQIRPVLAGWMGHAEPFAFETSYRPANSIESMRVGTPPIIQLSALHEALKLWDDVDLQDIREASIHLSQRFITEVESRCPDLILASPRDPQHRGSQVSFACEFGHAVIQALIDRGVIGDFRAPDVMRFGFAPLYIDENDVIEAARILQDVLDQELWRDPAYQRSGTVT